MPYNQGWGKALAFSEILDSLTTFLLLFWGMINFFITLSAQIAIAPFRPYATFLHSNTSLKNYSLKCHRFWMISAKFQLNMEISRILSMDSEFSTCSTEKNGHTWFFHTVLDFKLSTVYNIVQLNFYCWTQSFNQFSG